MKTIIEELKMIINAIEGQIYIVGGYVRDLIIYGENNGNSEDIDIIFCGDINGLIKALKKYNYKIFTLKAKLGIYRATRGKNHLDIALLKGNNLYKDLESRDFTINSICMNIQTGEIIDYFEGLSHINKRILKETSENSISTDPVRILRGLRFTIEYDMEIDYSTLNHIIEAIDKIKICPKERIFTEFMKIIKVDSKAKLGVLLQQIKPLIGNGLTSKNNNMFSMQTYRVYKDFIENQLNLNQLNKKMMERKIGEFEIESFIAVSTILIDNIVESKDIIKLNERFGFPKDAKELIIKSIKGGKFVINYYKEDLQNLKPELYDFFKEYGDYLPYILIVSYCKDVFSSNMKFEELFYKFNIEYMKYNSIKENRLLNAMDIIKLTGIKGRTISEAIEFIDKEVYFENIKTEEQVRKALIHKYLCG